MRWFLLAFLIVPALEIGVFIWVGGSIGPWWVVGLILLTGLTGITLAKQQGLETWHRAQQSMNEGRAPTQYIVDGICIFAGAILLFMPGFITDIVGLILVLPLTRGPFKYMLDKWMRWHVNKYTGTIIYRK